MGSILPFESIFGSRVPSMLAVYYQVQLGAYCEHTCNGTSEKHRWAVGGFLSGASRCDFGSYLVEYSAV